eukprot:GHUV01031195.1.p1 GENE.GHUV01031195.1~~GHUV01031195.1.p1  ORF type:complete len:391 (+),score=148.69 GHUV01031195.1:342-1514(+)
MEATMTDWYRSILAQDLEGQPQQMGDGTLRTPGVIDFFRMLNEQVSVLEEISGGEVLLAAARRSLKLMQDFVKAQQELLKPGSLAAIIAAAAAVKPAAAAAAPPAAAAGELAFEMVCAQVNNSVDCYNQSLEFTENVQLLLDEGYRSELDVEETCRVFLDLAKAWSNQLIYIIYSDAGLVDQWRRMYNSQEWLNGTTTATIRATLEDYFTDVSTFVEPGFCRRVCEGVLEEYVRRSSSAAVAALEKGPAAAVAAMGVAVAADGDADDMVLSRLVQDERDVQVFFEPFVPLDKLVKRVAQLAGLRELLDSRDPEGVVAGYEAVLELNPAITPAMVDTLMFNRAGLSKAQIADIGVQCREAYSKAIKKQGGVAAGAAGAAAAESKGWRFWGR